MAVNKNNSETQDIIDGWIIYKGKMVSSKFMSIGAVPNNQTLNDA